MIKVLLLFSLVLISAGAHAYVGPGLGMGAIGAIIGVLFTILMAILGVFWYPLKRMFKKNKIQNNETEEQAQDD